MYWFLAEGRRATLPVFLWRWTSELSKGNSGSRIHECEVQNAAAIIRCDLQPLECFLSVAAHINFTHRPLLPLAKHVSKSPHGCSFNKTAKVLHFTGYIFVLYRCCCEGNVLLYRCVPALRFSANKSSDLGQKGRGVNRRKRESRIAQTLRFLLKLG